MTKIFLIILGILCLYQVIKSLRAIYIMYKMNKALDDDDTEKLFRLWKKL